MIIVAVGQNKIVNDYGNFFELYRGREMSSSYHSFCVVLEKDVKDEDADRIESAIRMIKGVIDVKRNVSDASDYVAAFRAKHEIAQKVLEVLK